MTIRELSQWAERKRRPTARQLAEVVKECVESGVAVEIDGLGVFECGEDGRYIFTQPKRPAVFLAYVEEDLLVARKLHDQLQQQGCDPWLDRVKLLPGQNWPRAIEHAIAVSDYFVPLFSRRSVSKSGMFQSELRYALDCAARRPLDEDFFVPVRLEECRIPSRIKSAIQYVDVFPDWSAGVANLLRSLKAKR